MTTVVASFSVFKVSAQNIFWENSQNSGYSAQESYNRLMREGQFSGKISPIFSENRENSAYFSPVFSYQTPYIFPVKSYAPEKLPVVSAASRYPGCTNNDILIGGQMWAACNAADWYRGSDAVSGWFFHGERYPSFQSENDAQKIPARTTHNDQLRSWSYGPCAAGYRLPTRFEWETAHRYAQSNGISVATLLDLPYNGSFLGFTDYFGNKNLDARLDVGAGYWTSSVDVETPFVMHLDSNYGGYRTDGTDLSPKEKAFRWQKTAHKMELVPGKIEELANIRCIRY